MWRGLPVHRHLGKQRFFGLYLNFSVFLIRDASSQFTANTLSSSSNVVNNELMLMESQMYHIFDRNSSHLKQ